VVVYSKLVVAASLRYLSTNARASSSGLFIGACSAAPTVPGPHSDTVQAYARNYGPPRDHRLRYSFRVIFPRHRYSKRDRVGPRVTCTPWESSLVTFDGAGNSADLVVLRDPGSRVASVIYSSGTPG
jgi:hypothetical protein